MFCNKCGKNPAVVHYTQVINNNVMELHLCEPCAKKQGLFMQKHFSVSDFLGSITDGKADKSSGIVKVLKCSECGMTFEDFRKNGRLGCAHCYATFKNSLKNILKRIHGSETHVGKIPIVEESADNAKLIKLKESLKNAVEKEEYEKAAEIRDKIKKLEREQKKQQ